MNLLANCSYGQTLKKAGGEHGVLITFEGGDCVGKSLQILLLSEALKQMNFVVRKIQFPERIGTATGPILDGYLGHSVHLCPQAATLLFSANRWEKQHEITNGLMAGEVVILDRYVHSGLAFSEANGLDFFWSISADRGLIRPDIVIFLDLAPLAAMERRGFGEERFEKLEFQEKVYKNFKCMIDESWKVVDASKAPPVVHSTVMDHCLKKFPICQQESINYV